jgi:hypothetical protein
LLVASTKVDRADTGGDTCRRGNAPANACQGDLPGCSHSCDLREHTGSCDTRTSNATTGSDRGKRFFRTAGRGTAEDARDAVASAVGNLD